VPLGKQGSCALLACSTDVQDRVYRELNSTGTGSAAVDITTITFEQVIEALKATQHEAENTDKGRTLAMSKVRASSFKGDNPSTDCFYYLENKRAALAKPTSVSDMTFQTIVKNSLHPELAIQVSTDRGTPFTSNEAWRNQLLAKAPVWDAQQRAKRAKQQAKLQAAKGFGLGKKQRYNNNKNRGGFNKNGIQKKQYNQPQQDKQDHSCWTCVKCGGKDHGPRDRDSSGNFICPKNKNNKKKVSGSELKATRQHLAVTVLYAQCQSNAVNSAASSSAAVPASSTATIPVVTARVVRSAIFRACL
jgi:hypothetical protein